MVPARLRALSQDPAIVLLPVGAAVQSASNPDDSPRHQVSQDADANSMKLNLQAGSLSVQLETRVAASAEVIELCSRLGLTTQMLHETQEQLYSALKRIGYLEGILQGSSIEIQ